MPHSNSSKKNTLGKLSQGKKNNLNLIRFIAAYLVLFAHSYPIALGASHHDWITSTIGISISALAVNVFFVLSGFLVTESLLSRNDPKTYILSRVLRIYPALIILVFLSVFVLGLTITTTPVVEYFSSEITQKYISRNSILLFGVKYYLPGVFTENIYPNTVNGSLWTLPTEVKLYIFLLIFYLICTKSPHIKSHSRIVFKILISTLCLYYLFLLADDYLVKKTSDNSHRLPFLFLLGSTCNLFKHYVKLSWHQFTLIFLLLITIYAIDKYAFQLFLYISLPVIIFTTAYLLKGKILMFNRIGDYSYGIYLYAFPIQQTIEHMEPDLSILEMIFYSSCFTILFSIFSWHLIEKKFIGLKKRIV